MSPRTFEVVRQRSRNQSIGQQDRDLLGGQADGGEDQRQGDEAARGDAARADAGHQGGQDDDHLVDAG